MTTLALNLVPPTLPPIASTSDGAVDGSSEDFTFHDLVSIFNPLQHIPVISTLYRAITGDTIGSVERVAGDTLYGGWMGLASSVANLVFEKETGKDFGDSALAFVETGELPTFAASGVAKAPEAESPYSGGPDKNYGIAALAAIEVGRGPKAIAASAAKAAATKSKATVAALGPSSKAPAVVGPRATNEAKAIPGAVAALAPLQTNASKQDAGTAALQSSLLGAHISPELGQRALDAYRKSVGTGAPAADLTPAI